MSKKKFGSRIAALLLALLLAGQCVPVAQVYAAEGPVQVSSAADLPADIPADVTYELTADITLNPDQMINSIAGVLDGKGYTITLNGKPLAKEVTGTVQNLKTDGNIKLGNGEGIIAINLNGGTVQNCASTVVADPGWADPTGGLVGTASNAKIYNSYFAGTVKDMFGLQVNFGIAQSADASTQLKNCYYANGNNGVAGGDWNRDNSGNGKKSLDEMKTPAFVELLNTDALDTGFVWAASEGDLPVLVAKDAGGDTPAADHQISKPEDLPSEITAGATYELAADITLNPDQMINSIAGTLDGKGHTITLNGKPLAKEVTGTVQNLGVASNGPIQGPSYGWENPCGSITVYLTKGKIYNCWSTADVNDGFLDTLGGLVSRAEEGELKNCFYTGNINNSSCGGLIGNTSSAGKPTMIQNCYFVPTDKITKPVGNKNGYEMTDVAGKTLDEMKNPVFAELLNADNVGSGYVWEAVAGDLPKLVPGGAVIEPAKKEELEAAINTAQSKMESNYTKETWAAMQEALTAAKALMDQFDASQEDVDAAAAALNAAIAALQERVWEHAPVELPQSGVVTISSAAELAKISGKDQAYQLTQDIVITENFNPVNLAGIFDGDGHTITIRTESVQELFSVITETGVVQNLKVKVESNFTNRQECGPYGEKLQGGMIVNCVSEVTGQHSAGFVRKMEDGVIANCLTMGHNRRGAFVHFQKSTDHKNSNGYKSGKLYNCYWAASNSAENIPPENMINCAPVGDEELRSTAFIDQLNSNKGAFGTTWTLDKTGYPYFGMDYGENVIDGKKNLYPVQFVWHDGRMETVENGILRLSPQMTSNGRLAGKFQLEGVPADSTITWSCDDRADQEIMRVQDNDTLYVYQDGGAVVRATERRADGSERLAAEIRVVSASNEIEELRLLLDGKVIESSATVQGSETKRLEVQARYTGETEFKPMPSYLVKMEPEDPSILRTEYNTTVFNFRLPGTSKLTVTDKNGGASVTVSLTSTYVPITSIKPAISGTEEIQYRNSMGSGEFVSIPQTVFVEPENASYKEHFSVETSDVSVAEYGGYAYTPHKAGTVTFTAKINDNGVEREGSSQVTFVYKNPLKEVTASSQKIELAQGTTQSLPLTFVGQPDNPHAVTEPDLEWSFSQKGIVSISRPNPLVQVRNTGGPDDGNWVASTEFEVKALRPGTVVVTGTPVDTSGKAKPVKLTITVTGDGSPVVGFDIPKFIEEGKATATAYLEANNTFSFGEEWLIYTMLRDGQPLPQEKLNQYYGDVVANVHSWGRNILPTEVERTAIVVNILGKDITDVEGVNLVELICNHPNLTKQGSNALMAALMALDMRNTEIPADMKWSRDSIIAELLTYQNDDGGFGLAKDGRSGVDMTSMILQVLARYQDRPEVAAAVDQGVAYLAKAVEKSLNLGNAESIAQVIMTFAILEKDLTQEPGFGDEMENLMSALSEYMVKDEGFKHDKKLKVDKMATIQSMQALCAYERFLNGQSGYWDLTTDEVPQIPDVKPDTKPDTKPDVKPDTKPGESTNTTPETMPSQKPQQSGSVSGQPQKPVQQVSKISKQELDAIKGQDKNLRMTGKLSSGAEYAVVINGMDVKESRDVDVTVLLGGGHEEEIRKLAENLFIFRFTHADEFPGPMYLELPTGLEDGDYLLLRYNADGQKAELMEKVTVENGTLKCVLSAGGEYFLAKHATSQSLNELEESDTAAQTTQENEGSQRTVIIAVCVAVVVVGCGIAAYVISKKRGSKKEQ